MGGNLMRTVTFADANLVDQINSSVVAVWHDQNPTFAKNFGAAQQAAPTKQQIAAYPLGGGASNMLTYFCTPEGKVVHFLQGYWSAEHFAEELRFAQSQQRMVQERSQPLGVVTTEGIDRRVAQLTKQQAGLASVHPTEFNKPVHESKVRRQHAALGLKIASYHQAKNTAGQSVDDILTMLLKQNLMRGVIS